MEKFPFLSDDDKKFSSEVLFSSLVVVVPYPSSFRNPKNKITIITRSNAEPGVSGKEKKGEKKIQKRIFGRGGESAHFSEGEEEEKAKETSKVVSGEKEEGRRRKANKVAAAASAFKVRDNTKEATG